MWQQVLDDSWNEPDRHDHYLMQLAAMWGSKDAKLGDFVIEFRERKAEKKPISLLPPEALTLEAQRAAIAKSEWKARRKAAKEARDSKGG